MGDFDTLEEFFNEEELLGAADQFLASISGVDDFEKPKATLLLRIGGANTSSQEIDAGPVVLTKRNMQGCYVIDLHFESIEGLKKCHRAVEEYAKYVNIMDGSVDENHMLSVVIAPNDDYWDGYVIGMIPVFFAVTAKAPGEPADTYRMAFRKDTLFYYDIGAAIEESDIENKPFVIS